MKFISKLVALALLIPFPSIASAQSHTLQPEVLNPPAIDGPGAFRAFLGEQIGIRCNVRNTQTGAVLTGDDIANQFPNLSLRVDKTRGAAGQFQRTGGGTATYTGDAQGLNVFQCTAATLPGNWRTLPMMLAVDIRRLTAADVTVFATRPNNLEPINRISVEEPFVLRAKAFSDGRIASLPVSISEVVWTRQSSPCGQNATAPVERIFDTSVLRSSAPTNWSAEEGATVRAEIGQTGDFFACVRIPSGQNGLFIEKVSRIRAVADATLPVIEQLVITQANGRGQIDRLAPGQFKPLEEYEVRAVLRDDNPAGLEATFRNQHGKVDGTMTAADGDRGVFVGRLPVTDGLQIVTVTVSEGDDKSQTSTFAVAAREFLSPLNEAVLERKRHGQQLFATLDLLEDTPTHVFAPKSVEALLKDLPRKERAALFPPLTIRSRLAEIGAELPTIEGSPMLMDVVIVITADDLRFNAERGPRLTIGAEIDVDARARIECFRVAFGAEIPVTCPINFKSDIRIEGKLAGPIEVVRDFTTGELNLALAWNDWTNDLSVEADFSGLAIANSFAAGQIEDIVQKELSKDSLADSITKDSDFRRFRILSREWIGLPLSENRSVALKFDIPKLDGGVIPAQIATTAFDAEFGGNFASIRMGGASTPANLTFPNFFPDYARTIPENVRAKWRSRDSLLIDTSPLERFPPDNLALMMHLDTLNAHLAGLFAAGYADFDLPAPDFVDLFISGDPQTSEEVQKARDATPFAALSRFPDGRVRLRMETAPRLTLRGDLDDHMALEIGPAVLDIDLRNQNGSRLVMRFAAILATKIGPSAMDPPRGFSIDFSQSSRCRVNDPGIGLNKCKTAFGIEIIERQGFTEHALLPDTGSPQERRALEEQWSFLRKTLGIESLFSSTTQPKQSHAAATENVWRLALSVRRNPANPEADPFLPLTFEVPPIVITDAVGEAMGITLTNAARAGVVSLRPHPNVDMLGADRGWIGLIGQMVPIRQ